MPCSRRRPLADAMTADQVAALLAHLQVLTRRVFELSGTDDKVALMMSLQDLMVAFKVDQ